MDCNFLSRKNHVGFIRRRRHLLHVPRGSRRVFCTILFIAILPGGISGGLFAHEFYISLCKIRYFAGQKTVEVVVRAFADDLENAVQKRSGLRLHLFSPREHTQSDSLVNDYLNAHFTLALNGTPIPLHYEGKRQDFDVAECRWRAENSALLQKITVQTDLLTDIYEDQTNVVQVEAGGEKKRFNLNKQVTTISLVFQQGEWQRAGD